jgi:NADH-quinone oxidoreductase subunit N
MVSFFPEIFLSINLLILLTTGSILNSSIKYNYPIISYKSFVLLILFWTFVLLRFKAVKYFNSYFVFDYLSLFSKIAIVISLALCLNFNSNTKKKTFEYYVLILISLLGLFGLSSSNDLLSVYLSLELSTFSFYILTLYTRTSSFSIEAALKYFILGALSSILLVFGISLIYGFTGTTKFSHFLILDLTSYNPVLTIFIKISFILFSLGLLFKLGCVPFHIWLADVYEGSPTSATVIFSVVPKISIFSLLIRVIYCTKLEIWFYLLSILGFISIIFGSFHALRQTKIKRILAFSGISHVGFAILGLSCGTKEGFSSCILYILVYMCTAGFLWGFILCMDSSNNRTAYLVDYVQWIKTNPTIGLISILVIFSLAGIPPLAGFFSKFAVFLSCMQISLYSAVACGLLISSISILYYLRLIKIISFENKSYKRTIILNNEHVISIGVFGFFLIFFVGYGNLISLVSELIVLQI